MYANTEDRQSTHENNTIKIGKDQDHQTHIEPTKLLLVARREILIIVTEYLLQACSHTHTSRWDRLILPMSG